MIRKTAAAALAVMALLTACGGDDDTAGAPGSETCLAGAEDCVDDPTTDGDTSTSAPPAAGMCLEGATDCDDTVEPGDAPKSSDEYRADAQSLLGVAEMELPPMQIRISRKGQETYALTEDYAIGRMTVELDQDAEGDWVVTKVTVELEEGPETFEA